MHFMVCWSVILYSICAGSWHVNTQQINCLSDSISTYIATSLKADMGHIGPWSYQTLRKMVSFTTSCNIKKKYNV